MKAYRKSRGGCLACKARKVKCCQRRPSCENCLRRSWPCNYVGANDHAASQEWQPRARFTQTPGSGLNTTDRRLLHHFRNYARPLEPFGSPDIWIKEIPAIAQCTPFLMHALLALAASHLAIRDPDQTTSQALFHRQRAINGVCQVIDDPGICGHSRQLEAVVAASYALAHQACYSINGLDSSITFYRGIETINNLPSMKVHTSGRRLFKRVDLTMETLARLTEEAHITSIDPCILDAAERSLKKIQYLCTEDPALRTFHQLHMDVIQSYRQNILHGMAQLLVKWRWLMSAPEAQIARILSQKDVGSLLLRAHWHIVDFFIDRSEVLDPGVCWSPATNAYIRTEMICALPILSAHDSLKVWPAQVASTLRQQCEKQEWFSISDAYELVKREPHLFS